jgi:glucose/arabinose dehydrogenase
MKKKKIFKKIIVIFLFLAILVWGGYSMKGSIIPLFFKIQKSVNVSPGINKNEEIEELDMEIIADNLAVPWEVVFLPDNSILITERAGNLVHLPSKNKIVIENINQTGEGGLLGMALHPNFSQNNFLYLYMTTDVDNRVIRYTYKDKELEEDRVIIKNIPKARFHNGGRIKFGPDGYLYITTGDAQKTQLSQDLSSLAGKILRVDEDGGLVEDNPFGSYIYSYGHRNPQGLAWDSEGNLWSTEHGPTAQDELNLIKKGANYGWPVISGEKEREEMENPVLQSGYDYTWAPSGMLYWDSNIFFTGLRGQAIYQAKIQKEKVIDFLVHFKEDFGRIRSINIGPDEMFYIITNNTDGRGYANKEDDKLIKIKPNLFK